MSERTFPEVSIPYGDKSVMAMKITCSCCPTVGYFPFQNGISRKPPVAAVQHFTNKGWVVGSNPRKDCCPDHARPSKRKGKKAMANMPAHAAEKPREPTWEEKQLINMKLMEVYDNPTTGYKSGWSDARVGRDLDYPRAWVTTIREAVFGPAGSNPAMDEFLSARDGLKAEHAAISAIQKELSDRYVAYAKRFDDIERLGKRIEREIGR